LSTDYADTIELFGNLVLFCWKGA